MGSDDIVNRFSGMAFVTICRERNTFHDVYSHKRSTDGRRVQTKLYEENEKKNTLAGSGFYLWNSSKSNLFSNPTFLHQTNVFYYILTKNSNC